MWGKEHSWQRGWYVQRPQGRNKHVIFKEGSCVGRVESASRRSEGNAVKASIVVVTVLSHVPPAS